jgi:hypothetical protein
MAKEPRATDSTTPKKRTTKTPTEAENGTKVVKVAKTTTKSSKNHEVTAMPAVAATSSSAPPLDEQIRIRAYELYLERQGQGGSPEQDWFQAAAEVYGESVA